MALHQVSRRSLPRETAVGIHHSPDSGEAHTRRVLVEGMKSMAMNRARSAPPSDGERWRIVEAAMQRNGYEPNALIETLHAAQPLTRAGNTAEDVREAVRMISI